ncbi:MAG: hypothetical protein ACTSYZ_08920 [Candidatus Helarchaeota archaeon]
MFEENLVLTSSTMNKITIEQFLEYLNEYKWEKIKIEICGMPRKDLKSQPILILDNLPNPPYNIIKNLKTPIESISISGIINNCKFELTGLIEDNLLRWIEFGIQSQNKKDIEPFFMKITKILKKVID